MYQKWVKKGMVKLFQLAAHSVFFHPACQSATGLLQSPTKFHRKDSSTISYREVRLVQAPVVSLNHISRFSVVTFAVGWIVGGDGGSVQNDLMVRLVILMLTF